MTQAEEPIRICSCRTRPDEPEDPDLYTTAYIRHFCDRMESLLTPEDDKRSTQTSFS